jgi:LysM repeat protein
MPKKIKLILILLVFFLGGCATVSYPPQIIQPLGAYHIVGSGQTLYGISKTYGVALKEIMRLNDIRNPNQIGVGERLFIPGAKAPLSVESFRPSIWESVDKTVGKRQYRVKWRYITLHHSATQEGNAEAFDRNHRRRGMGGLAYHFVIGNGTGSQNGEIEVGWRWIRQRETDRKGDIQICLVGDFNTQEPTLQQYDSLVKLIRTLIKQYSVPLYNVRRHKDIKGKITECPGRNFPYYKILADLRKAA